MRLFFIYYEPLIKLFIFKYFYKNIIFKYLSNFISSPYRSRRCYLTKFLTLDVRSNLENCQYDVNVPYILNINQAQPK